MLYIICGNPLEWNQTYDILDEKAVRRYFLETIRKGNLNHEVNLTRSDRLRKTVYSAADKKKFFPYFEVLSGKEPLGVIRVKFGFRKPKYEILSADWSLEGDPQKGNFALLHKGVRAAEVTSYNSAGTLRYRCEVLNSDDPERELMLCALLLMLSDLDNY